MTRLYENWKHYTKSEWRWANFSPQEMACRGTGKLRIDPVAMDMLQALRLRLGRPLIINSAYRSPEHNTNVGGVKGSFHLTAQAFDVSMANHDPAIFLAAAQAVGFTGFGFYRRNNFIHIDTGPARQWGVRWFKASEVSRYRDAPMQSELPQEKPLHPETVAEDKSLVGSVVGGTGALASGGTVLASLGNLSPLAQVVALGGLFLALAALAFIFRRQIGRLVR